MHSYLLTAAVFAMLVRNDPITLERQAIFGVSDDGAALSLICRPDKHEILITFSTDRYRGPVSAWGSLLSGVSSRFDTQSAPESDYWDMGDRTLSYGEGKIGSVTAKARFIDTLARSREFNIRYQVAGNDPQTVSLGYDIDLVELRSFLSLCGPKRVIRELQSMKSPAAPE